MAKKILKYPAEKIDELLTKADEQMATKSDLKNKVDKVEGKGLSTNDYSTAEKAKLGSIDVNRIMSQLDSLAMNKINSKEKGTYNGVATLDGNGKIPSSQLPSYVDDVIDTYTFAQFPTTGENGKIYIDRQTNKQYRWSGNGYAEISSSLALGETEQTAYSGAKGKKNAEDIAKLADDLEETHQLASNAERAISDVVESVIPAIESDVAKKATKSEAQGYATTAKNGAISAAATDAQNKANTAENNAKTYADGKVKGLADGQVATNTTAIATLQSGQTSIVAIVESQGQQIANLDSNKLGKNEQAKDSAKLGGVAAADYMQKSGGTFTGNVTINGTMTATATYHSSDERLKTFEGDVEVDLDKLKALPKKYFHWTADADGKRQLGTSAQAVEKVFPELVSTDVDDHKSVNYANLSIVALAAIDKLADQNAELAKENAELAKQNAKLAEKNAELERRLARIEKLLNIE